MKRACFQVLTVLLCAAFILSGCTARADMGGNAAREFTTPAVTEPVTSARTRRTTAETVETTAETTAVTTTATAVETTAVTTTTASVTTTAATAETSASEQGEENNVFLLLDYSPYSEAVRNDRLRSEILEGFSGISEHISDSLPNGMSYNTATLKILRSDDSGCDIAVRCSGGGEEYTRYFALEKGSGGWKSTASMLQTYLPKHRLCEDVMNGNTKRYNAILSGTSIVRRASGEPFTITRKGVGYTRIERLVSIDDMREAFREGFAPALAEKYIEKYVDGVYYEEEGRLYRRTSEPRYYLPSYLTSPEKLSIDILSVTKDLWVDVAVPVTWTDSVRNESFVSTLKIKIKFKDYSFDYRNLADAKIQSEIPIRQIEEKTDER